MSSVLYESVAPQHNLNSLQRKLSESNNHPLLAMKKAFTKIIEINYEPAFDAALAILDILFPLQASMSLMHDLRELINLAQEIVGNKATLRHDFIGRIYHRVTGNLAMRKGYATFYTKIPIAYFLAFLSICTYNENWNTDWCNLDSLKEFKVCDFACGSGTLLSASYEAMLSKYRKGCISQGKYPDLVAFHKHLLENSIWGFDALEHAVQIASIVLSLHEPGVPISKMNLYHIPLDGIGSLGSLNFWWANTQLVPIKRHSIRNKAHVQVSLPTFDLIIMNPPFARTTSPGEYRSRPRIFDFVAENKCFQKLWNTYKKTIADMEKSLKNLGNKHFKKFYREYVESGEVFRPKDVNPLRAGAAFPFVILADRYLKEGGRLALVLPKAVLESAAFFVLRSFLLSNYHIEYIILSAEKGNLNFSYSTNLSEVLLIARKFPKKSWKNDSLKTYVVVFKKQPENILEGKLMAKRIVNEIEKGIEWRVPVETITSKAEVFVIKRKALEDFVWNFSMLIDFPPMLREVINEIPNGNLVTLSVPIYKLHDLRSKGLSIRVIHPVKIRSYLSRQNLFKISPMGKYSILRKTGKNVMSSLSLDPVNIDRVSTLVKNADDIIQENMGRIIIPEAVRFNTYPLLSVWSSKPLISNVAFVLSIHPKRDNLKNSDAEKSLCAWLNFTLMVAYLKALFSSVEGEYGHIRGWHLRVIPLPDLTNVCVVKELSKVFDKYASERWLPIPMQYERTLENEDMLRLNYDIDILKALSRAYNKAFREENIEKILLRTYEELIEILR